MKGILMNNHIYLAHHGIKGMKWGVRRFQNPDGSLTPAGKKRYGVLEEAVKRANDFSRYAESNAKRYAKSTTWEKSKYTDYQAESIRISKRQAARYKKLSEKYTNMLIDVRQVSKADLKEAKRFCKDFFTDAEYAFIDYSGRPSSNYEDHD